MSCIPASATTRGWVSGGILDLGLDCLWTQHEGTESLRDPQASLDGVSPEAGHARML